MAQANKTSGPRLACEITQGLVVAARATDDGSGLDAYTARQLTSGTVMPRLAAENFVFPDVLKQAVNDALTTVGSKRRDIIAIVPDASARVSLLDFDTLPEKKPEVDGVIRFRLKKSLPFDVDNAALSYDVRQVNGKVHVVAAVVLSSVLAEYENLFRDLGYVPGVVLPSTLASLGNIDSSEPVLVIKADAYVTTLAIVANGDLLLYRPLEAHVEAGTIGEQIVPDVHASLVFFEDTYNMRVKRIVVGGLMDAGSIGEVLEGETGIRVQNLVASHLLGSARPNFPPSMLAGVTGALLA